MPKFVNIAAYKFFELSDLRMLRSRLLALCKCWELKGTILLSPEGINLFVAGSGDKVELLLAELRAVPGLGEFFLNQADIAGLVHKYTAYSLIALSLLHGLAAIKHHLIDKDDTLRRMTRN